MVHVNHVTLVTLVKIVIFLWLLFSPQPSLVLYFSVFACTCWPNISSLSEFTFFFSYLKKKQQNIQTIFNSKKKFFNCNMPIRYFLLNLDNIFYPWKKYFVSFCRLWINVGGLKIVNPLYPDLNGIFFHHSQQNDIPHPLSSFRTRLKAALYNNDWIVNWSDVKKHDENTGKSSMFISAMSMNNNKRKERYIAV